MCGHQFSSVQFSRSVVSDCNPMDCSTPGFPVHRQLPEFTQTHVHWVGDAIQPSHPLSLSPPAFNLSQHQGLFRLFVPGGQNIGASASASVLPTESLCYLPETLWINYTSILKKELNIFLSLIVNWNFLKLKLVTVLANMSFPLFLRHPLGPAGPQSLWDHTLWRVPLKRTSLGTVPCPKSLPSPTFSWT